MLKIYVDGSFINGACGYGAVIIEDDQVIHEISGNLSGSEYESIRQVAGEIEAAMKSLDWAAENNYFDVQVFYDYKGVECWATKEWKAKNPLTKKYAAYFNNCKVSIEWVKVKAHSGVEWNDRADELAKNGASKKSNTLKSPSPKALNISSSLENFGEEVSDFFISEGFNAVYDNIYNNMFVRIEFFDDSLKRAGILDIYKTKKKNYTPDLRGFKDDLLKTDVLSSYEMFLKNKFS